MIEDAVNGLVVVVTQDVIVFRVLPGECGKLMYEPAQRLTGTRGLASVIPEQRGYVRVDYGDGWFNHLAAHQYKVLPALEQLAECAE